MWHPESECLFEETDPEAVMSQLDQGCADVTGDADYEEIARKRRYDDSLKSLRKRAEGQQAVFKEVLLRGQRYPSCLNCIHWGKTQCIEFEVLPPPEVIVFSCLTNWEPDIPF